MTERKILAVRLIKYFVQLRLYVQKALSQCRNSLFEYHRVINYYLYENWLFMETVLFECVGFFLSQIQTWEIKIATAITEGVYWINEISVQDQNKVQFRNSVVNSERLAGFVTTLVLRRYLLQNQANILWSDLLFCSYFPELTRAFEDCSLQTWVV